MGGRFMKIFPAIDVYGGKAVRLFRGDYDKMTVYGDDPSEIAAEFAALGAKYLHIVDLEGAKTGRTSNISTIEKIVSRTDLFTEVGGGIRDYLTAEKYFAAGVNRVILGTAAVKDRSFLTGAIEKYGEKIAVGADIKDGFVAIKGWTEKSDILCEDFFADMEKTGVKTIICTDISKDGAMSGTSVELYRRLSGMFSVNIIASGGVSSIDDIVKLKEIPVYGAIIGKAYYTGAIDLKSAIEAAR